MITREELKKDLKAIINNGKQSEGDSLHRKWKIVDEISNKYGVFSFYEITRHFEFKTDIDYIVESIADNIILDFLNENGTEIDIKEKDKSDIIDYLRLINQVYKLGINDNTIQGVSKNMYIETSNKSYELYVSSDKIVLNRI